MILLSAVKVWEHSPVLKSQILMSPSHAHEAIFEESFENATLLILDLCPSNSFTKVLVSRFQSEMALVSAPVAANGLSRGAKVAQAPPYSLPKVVIRAPV